MLISLLAAHPEIAAIVSESRLFDRGVGCLFDNHEIEPAVGTHLAAYIPRDDLRDVVRDLCDRVLMTMQERVNPDARIVAEKTPAQRTGYAKTLARKLECYPDARFLHVVREREDVVRSLARSPWSRGTRRDFTEHWRTAVDTARELLGTSPNYREVAYDDLATEPVETMAEIFAWLGIDHDEGTLAHVEGMSRERISTHGPGRGRDPDAGLGVRLRATVKKLSRRAGVRPGLVSGTGEAVATRLMEAVRQRDGAGIAELTRDDILLELRSGAGDLRATGDDARDALSALGRAIFGQRFVSEQWNVSVGDRAVSFDIAAVAGDTTRVDASISVMVRDGQVVQVSIVSAGDPRGRESELWSPDNPRTAGTASR